MRVFINGDIFECAYFFTDSEILARHIVLVFNEKQLAEVKQWYACQCWAIDSFDEYVTEISLDEYALLGVVLNGGVEECSQGESVILGSLFNGGASLVC